MKSSEDWSATCPLLDYLCKSTWVLRENQTPGAIQIVRTVPCSELVPGLCSPLAQPSLCFGKWMICLILPFVSLHWSLWLAALQEFTHLSCTSRVSWQRFFRCISDNSETFGLFFLWEVWKKMDFGLPWIGTRFQNNGKSNFYQPWFSARFNPGLNYRLSVFSDTHF